MAFYILRMTQVNITNLKDMSNTRNIKYIIILCEIFFKLVLIQ